MLRGITLSQHLKKNGLPRPVEEAGWIVSQAARGVAAAHAKGLVHRDIKPGNVMLLEDKTVHGDPQIKVLDFGLVAGPMRLNERLTLTGVVVGTPHYIAPELVEHNPRVTPACDVYALGVLLYQLVVGHRPFQGESFFAVIDAHLSRPIPRPRTTDAGELIKPALRRVWTRALNKDPTQRYANAGELARAIEVAVFGESAQSATTPVPTGETPVGERHLVTVITANFADAALEVNAAETQRADVGARRPRRTISVPGGRDRPVADPRQPPDTLRGGALEALQDECCDRVRAAGGMVTPSPVGSLRAIFGLPSAGEEDALRALEAALEIEGRSRKVLGPGAVEIGLHTRFVLAAPRRPGSRELRPLTDPYEVAAAVGRETRGRGRVGMSGTTYRTLRRHLADPLPVTGWVAGEAVHVVERSLQRSDMRANPLLGSPPVGREGEILLMRAWVDRAMQRRRSQIHLVTGAAGIGKSRLVAALMRAAEREHPGLQVLHAQLGSVRNSPFGVFERLLSDAVGATTGARMQKVVAWITQAVTIPGDAQQKDDATRILRLIGMSDAAEDGVRRPTEAPQVARQQAFAAFANLFGSVATQGGVLMLVDDAQHADSGSLDLLDHLGRELEDFPVCTILFARDGSDLDTRYERSMHIEPLDADSALSFARVLAQGTPLSEDALGRIVDRAEGNPLFLEELVRAANEGPIDLVRQLPDSIRAVVSARIDSLGSAQRAVLQASAVVGRDFWTGAVAAQPAVDLALGGDVGDPTKTQPEFRVADLPAVEDVLYQLERAGFVTRQPSSRFDTDMEWRFVNQMTLDAAYQLSVESQLREGHLGVARWLGERAAGATSESHALMALHLERASEHGRAAEAWRAAGDAARDRFANSEAATAYQKALELHRGWPAVEVARVQVERGICLLHSGEIERARRILDAARKSRDLTATERCKALRHLARAAAWAGDLDRQKRLLKRAVKSAGEAALAERLMVASDFAYSLIRSGRTDMASRLLDDAIATAYAAESLSDLLLPLANLHQGLGLLYRNRGRLVDAEREARSSMDLFEQIGYPAGTATTLTSLSVCLRDLGRFDEAAEAAGRSADYFREWGYRVHELTALINLAWSHFEGGNAHAARRLVQRLRDEFADEFCLPALQSNAPTWPPRPSTC